MAQKTHTNSVLSLYSKNLNRIWTEFRLGPQLLLESDVLCKSDSDFKLQHSNRIFYIHSPAPSESRFVVLCIRRCVSVNHSLQPWWFELFEAKTSHTWTKHFHLQNCFTLDFNFFLLACLFSEPFGVNVFCMKVPDDQQLWNNQTSWSSWPVSA